MFHSAFRMRLTKTTFHCIPTMPFCRTGLKFLTHTHKLEKKTTFRQDPTSFTTYSEKLFKLNGLYKIDSTRENPKNKNRE